MFFHSSVIFFFFYIGGIMHAAMIFLQFSHINHVVNDHATESYIRTQDSYIIQTSFVRHLCEIVNGKQ